MDKISIDDIVNQEELPLLNYLECPIDNLISLAPVMCKKCETCFCQDCIDNWKKKSNICPMRCNPMELITIDKTILKQQLDKIRLPCTNYKLGCLSKLLIKEVQTHEKICEYKGIKCDKCGETVPMIGLLYHLYESCKKNTVNCFICNTAINLNNFLSHIQNFEVQLNMCKICVQPLGGNSDSADLLSLHGKTCSLKLINCQKCKLPELQSEILNLNHRCLNDCDLSNLNTYLKSLQGRYELSINEIIIKQDEKYKDFLKKFGDINNEILRRENEKCLKLDQKKIKLSDDFLKKMFGIKKEKRENLNRLNSEIQELEKKIECIEINRKILNYFYLSFLINLFSEIKRNRETS
jgi:hypothetical protein